MDAFHLLVVASLFAVWPVDAGYPPSPNAQPVMPPPSMMVPGYFNSRNNYSVVHSRYHKAATVNRPIIINLDILLIKVKGTVEKEGIFETVIAIFIRWTDERLAWNPAEFGNITSLSLDSNQIGLPDIAMINSADHLYGITRHSKFQVHLTSNGFLKYVPTGTARTWCELKLFTFPFDVQTCSLEFESWSLDHKSMTFDGLSDILLDKAFMSQLWLICDLKPTTYDQTYFTNETFTRVRFDITVKRRVTFYVVNLIFPCCTLSMIQLCVFWISSTDTTADRIGFSTTNLLTLVVFQTIVTEELPKTSDAVTALSKYIIALILTAALGIFESVLVERFFRTFQKPPPWWLFRLMKPIPVLWRELPPSHPDIQEAENICLSQRRPASKRAKVAPAPSPVKVKRKIKIRDSQCQSPVFTPRSSLLEEERLQLINDCKGHFYSAEANITFPQDPFAAIDRSSLLDNCDISSDPLDLSKPSNSVPRLHLTDDSLDDGVSTMRHSNGLAKQANDAVGDVEQAAGQEAQQKMFHISPAASTPESEHSAVLVTPLLHRSNVSFLKMESPKCYQRIMTMPALSPRLAAEQLQQQQLQQKEEQRQSDGRSSGGKYRRRGTVMPTPPKTNPILQQLQERNACLWMELGFKIDFVTFFICLLLSIFIPIGLFLPLIYLGNNCIPSYTLL